MSGLAKSDKRAPRKHEKEISKQNAMATIAVISGWWTCVHMLGRGASSAVVSLATADALGVLFAVKSAHSGMAATEHLRREGSILSTLRYPHVVHCLGLRAAPDGDCQLLLELTRPWRLGLQRRWPHACPHRLAAVAAAASANCRGMRSCRR
jgi:hypothetical protein